MALVNKIDSNIVELRIAEEDTIGVLPGTPNWVRYEPNSFLDFGGNVVTIARDPINSSRQREKGVVVDVEAAGGFTTDLTASNLQDIMQGFVLADLRTKGELDDAVVDGTTNGYEPPAGGTAYSAGDLVLAKGFDNAVNNGLKRVTGVPTGTEILVTDTALVDEANAGGVGKIISKVGHQFAATDLSVVVSGTWPRYVSAAFDLTKTGILPGEWFYVGGDDAAESFATAADNGWKRARAVAAGYIEVDKSDFDMVVEAGTDKTIRIYFGRVLRNETGTDIVRRTYQLERTLGVPDDAAPTDVQAEYILGAIPNEMTINVNTADKITVDLSFMPTDSEVVTATVGPKSGNRPDLDSEDCFNASSHVARVKLAEVVSGDENPDDLFQFLSEITVSLNNNIELLKAIGVIGAFDGSTGTLEVGSAMTAYFVTVEAMQAVRDNLDATFDIIWARENKGIAVDMPLGAISDARASVEQERPITLPLQFDAANGARVADGMDHTVMVCFYDYLPEAAMP